MREDLKKWKSWGPGKPRKGQSGEKVPHYCKKANEWRCMVSYPWGGRNYEERGDIEYVMGEFARYGETYDFNYEEITRKDDWQDHAHSFVGVLCTLIRWPEHFSVEGFEEQYSKQQIELIKAVREKLLVMGKKNES